MEKNNWRRRTEVLDLGITVERCILEFGRCDPIDTNTSSDKEESIVLESLPVKQNYSVESSRASLEMYREREKERDKDGNGGLLASGE
ncbi:hypothetical protein KQX54_008051 [Cotesia glomerata]|uniref:Uncharacterized protein n=1 Tax=Cotesia glomerata TaxID=32391 RepID=A0AAV7J671_COTGL|nr:hypothetical protein KQX54_008051 [Cotesia glomerata]